MEEGDGEASVFFCVARTGLDWERRLMVERAFSEIRGGLPPGSRA